MFLWLWSVLIKGKLFGHSTKYCHSPVMSEWLCRSVLRKSSYRARIVSIQKRSTPKRGSNTSRRVQFQCHAVTNQVYLDNIFRGKQSKVVTSESKHVTNNSNNTTLSGTQCNWTENFQSVEILGCSRFDDNDFCRLFAITVLWTW